MEEFKCLEKYENYFKNNEVIDYFNSTLNDNSDYQNLYQYFLFYKQNQMIQKKVTNKLKLNNDLENFKKTIILVYQKLKQIKNKVILVAGQVQSGKTDFAIGLTSKIIAEEVNKINIFINLTTNITNLNKQTKERFNEFYRTAKLNETVFRYEFSDLQKLVEKNLKLENHTLFFLLKNCHHLKTMNAYLQFLNQFNQKFNIVIIDDEGDNASFNTNANARTDNDLSTINQELNKMLHHFFQGEINLISITATPLVHYFIEKNNNLKPEYAFWLEAGNGYTGILEYNEESNKPESKIINIIESKHNDRIDINPSLKKAVICYLSLCCLDQNKIYGNKQIKPRMIINMDIRTEQHNLLKEQINFWLNRYKEDPTLIETHLDNYSIWELIDSLIPINDLTKNKLIEKFKNLIYKNKYELITFNSDSDSTKNLNFDKDENEKFQIIIGSNKLSRGVTIKNLICAYLSMRAQERSNIDVLLQRARWFGYHQNYFQYMRIFLTNDLFIDYTVAADLVNNLYNTIKYAQENQIKFKNIERFIDVQKFRADLKPVNDRAPTKWEIITLKNTFVRNRCKANDDGMNYLLNKFKSWWQKEYESESDYPLIRFKNLQSLINEWFINDQSFCFATGISEKDFNWIVKNNYLKFPTYIRLISKNINNIVYKPISISYLTYQNEFGFIIGNYTNQNLQNKNEIKIDLLPLEIWSKNNEINETFIKMKIYRLKLFLPLNDQNISKSEIGFRGT